MKDDLVLKFGGSLVEQLGAQLYPSATATVAELISNAWDADARNVWISIPFGTKWTRDSDITVLDDGHGMTRVEAQRSYLIVGRKRRVEEGTDLSPGGRPLHGRKGIGKLAAFGTAGILECHSLKAGSEISFRLDYDRIRQLKPTEDYRVEPAERTEPLVSPDTGQALTHGTRIRLTRLWLKRALTESQFIQSMSRRFALSQAEINVFINGKPLGRFDIPVQFRLPRDEQPTDDSFGGLDDDGWGVEKLPNGDEVRWWIGFTEEPLEDERLQGISILTRDKMAQRPFLFDRAKGTEGQLGQEYLVGEVKAEWLDQGLDIDDDVIQSNRDMLQLEDERLEPLIVWGRRRLAWALRTRNRLRRDWILQEVEDDSQVDDLLEPFTANERKGYRRIAQNLARLPESSPEDVRNLMEQVINARSDVAVRELMEQIQDEEDPVQERMWKLVHEFGLIDARRLLSIIEARIHTIERLREAVVTGAREVPEIHNIILADHWLLDPRWDLLDHEVDTATFGITFQPEEDETGKQLDFLFVLTPGRPAAVDEAVVVEIKRGTHPNGRVRRATEDEVDKFARYVGQVQAYYQQSTESPVVRGLMIAQSYTQGADRKRRMLEQVSSPRLQFKTWDRVIDETYKLHVGWLELSRRRAER